MYVYSFGSSLGIFLVVVHVSEPCAVCGVCCVLCAVC